MCNEPLVLKVLKVKQTIGDFYIASISAKNLVDISFSDVRRLAKDRRDLEKYLGIQRPVSTARIKQIKKYLEGKDATFPTGVIVAIDVKCAEYTEIDDGYGTLQLSPYIPEDGVDETPIPYKKIARVIDGQHRIAAFMNEDKNYGFDFDNKDFDINLSIFVGADVSEQANIFATVNLTQTKVNKSLVYDLTELSKTPSPHKTCHNIAVILDEEKSSPLNERIKRLGTATPGRANEPLTQQAFVEALVSFISTNPVQDRNDLLEGNKISLATPGELKKCPFRNLFIKNKDLDIAEILFNYFSAIREKWPNSWAEKGKTGNLLPRSNAFKAFMKYLKDDVYLDLVGNNIGKIPTPTEFSTYFNHIDFEDKDFTTKNFSPGSGGQSTFLKVLRGELTLNDIVDDENQS